MRSAMLVEVFTVFICFRNNRARHFYSIYPCEYCRKLFPGGNVVYRYSCSLILMDNVYADRNALVFIGNHDLIR